MNIETADKLNNLRDLFIRLEEVATLQLVADLLKEGVNPEDIMACFHESLVEIGRMYHHGKYYMTGLILAGEIMRQAIKIIMPRLIKGNIKKNSSGIIIIGTIEGDIHDLGKNLASYFLETKGFEVHDLGVDVPPRIFLREILKYEPDAVGVSILLTACLEPLKRLVNLLKETFFDYPAPPLFVGCNFMNNAYYLENQFNISQKELNWLGADYLVKDPYDTLQLCLRLTKDKNKKAL